MATASVPLRADGLSTAAPAGAAGAVRDGRAVVTRSHSPLLLSRSSSLWTSVGLCWVPGCGGVSSCRILRRTSPVPGRAKRAIAVREAADGKGSGPIAEEEDLRDSRILQYSRIDSQADKRTLGELEAEFLEALQSFYYEGKPIMSNEKFDNLKEELMWEGSKVGMLNSDEQKFMEAFWAYQAGKPVISDTEYDNLKFRLKKSNSVIAIQGPGSSLPSRKQLMSGTKRAFTKGKAPQKQDAYAASPVSEKTVTAPSVRDFTNISPPSTDLSAKQESTERKQLLASATSFFLRNAKQLLRQISSFELAIAELFTIAALSALGTIIEQNESPQFYFDSYPEENPMFGFLSWRVIFMASLDHIYSSWYYLGLLLLLAASLTACSVTRQFPMVKVARRWSFLKYPEAFKKLPISETLAKARLGDFATLLMAEGFEVFARGPVLYAFRGLAGRYAPIGVHVALLLIMGGATLSAIAGYHGTVMVPQGLGFQIGDVITPTGILSTPSPVMNNKVQINEFFIDYRSNGAVLQFHSDISLLDQRDREVFRKTIAVNDPLKYGGLTMYQTDWAISAIQVSVDESEPYNLVMAQLEKGDRKLFGTFLPLGAEGLENKKGISILARDLQSVVIYDQEGKFVGVRRPGSGKPIVVDGVSLVINDVIGSSGLELKMDPGVPVVFFGFGALMLTSCISYLSHSQVWALQNGTSLVVGGKSNRAKAEFEAQLNKILDLVPEITVNLISNDNLLVADVGSGGLSSSIVEDDGIKACEVVKRSS